MPATGSDVVPKHQLARVGVQIDLSRQIRHVVDPHVVGDECQGHDQGDETEAVIVDARGQLAP